MRRLTQQDVESELKELGFELLSNYVSRIANLKLRGIECGHFFERNLGNIRKYSECPKCKHIRFEENARTKLKELGFELLSEYKNIRTEVTLKCLKCESTFKRTLKRLWKKPTHECGRGLDWATVDLDALKRDFFEKPHSIERLAKKYSIGHNTLRAKVRELKWKRPPLPSPKGPDHHAYKGVYEKGITLFSSYGPRLKQLGEDVRPDPEDSSLLNVKCYYSGCRRWYRPIVSTVVSRIAALEDRAKWGQNNLYCSEECKEQCVVYGKTQFKCNTCGRWFTGQGPQQYCEDCSPYRKTFLPSTKTAIYKRDLRLGRINKGSKYDIHHILGVAEFPEHADAVWNGWAIDVKSDIHSIIHNVCGLSKKDISCVDERYFELAINKLKENNAPEEIVDFCIKLYENR